MIKHAMYLTTVDATKNTKKNFFVISCTKQQQQQRNQELETKQVRDKAYSNNTN